MDSQHNALRIINEEHRNLAAVIDALNNVAQEVAQGKLVPDYKLLWSLIYYVDGFTDTFHHSKEDQEIFPRVRLRTHDIDELLDDLVRQHKKEMVIMGQIKTTLGRMEAEVPGAMQEFAQMLANYAKFHASHMHQEESIVLRKASQVLQPEDWVAIADAFGNNDDPLSQHSQSKYSAEQNEWFRNLYHRLVALVPEPWGVGERRTP